MPLTQSEWNEVAGKIQTGQYSDAYAYALIHDETPETLATKINNAFGSALGGDALRRDYNATARAIVQNHAGIVLRNKYVVTVADAQTLGPWISEMAVAVTNAVLTMPNMPMSKAIAGVEYGYSQATDTAPVVPPAQQVASPPVQQAASPPAQTVEPDFVTELLGETPVTSDPLGNVVAAQTTVAQNKKSGVGAILLGALGYLFWR